MSRLGKVMSLITAMTILSSSISVVCLAEEKQRNNPFADTYDKWYEVSVDYAT